MSSAPVYKYFDVFKKLYELTGARIIFKLPNGEVEGIIEHVVPKANLVTMNHVVILPERDYMGNYNVFFSEILSFTVVETAKEIDSKYVKWDYIERILDGSSFGRDYRITDLFDDLDEKSEFDEDAPYPDELDIDDFVLDLPPDLRRNLPQDNIILEAVNLEFNQAIKYISQQKMIGVAFEGPEISRLGKLAWVSISTPSCLFLFDIELLGKVAFDNGLKQIFQSKNVEKVIHDCRQPSDCLFHLFDTELINVFDTQVADYIVNTQRYSDKPAFKYVSSLDACLRNHLDVPSEYLHNRVKYYSKHDEFIFYRVRPVSNDYRDVLIKNVVYLCLLKEKLEELMLSPFHKAVDVYLNVLANASEPELLLEPSVPDMIPPGLVMQRLQTVRFVEPKESPIVPLICKFKDPQKGTVVEMSEETAVDTKNRTSEPINHALDIDRKLSNKSNSRKCNIESSRIDYRRSAPTQKSVIVEKMCLTNSKNHIDNVYHQLVNSLQASNISENVNVKPSQDYVSSFAVKKSFSTSAVPQNNTVHSKSSSHDDKNCISDLGKYKSDSYETLSGSSSDVSGDSSCSDIWAEFRLAFSESSCSEPSRRNIRFVPAGM